MLEFLFGWRKASKCKELLRCARCRLKLLRNKRDVMVRQLREDIAQLLVNGHRHSSSFSRVEQLFKDQSIMAAYDLLDHFCEFIIINISYIRRNRECPNDINEAVSSLIFAAARCADLPELQVLRKLFGERYGNDFAVAAVELHPGNHVNPQISEKLSVKYVPHEAKLKLLEEIAIECNVLKQVHEPIRKPTSGVFRSSDVCDLEAVGYIDNLQAGDVSLKFNILARSPCGSTESSDITSDSLVAVNKRSTDSPALSGSGYCDESKKLRSSSGSRHFSKRRKSFQGSNQRNFDHVPVGGREDGRGRRRRSISRSIHHRGELPVSKVLSVRDLESKLYYYGSSDCSDTDNFRSQKKTGPQAPRPRVRARSCSSGVASHVCEYNGRRSCTYTASVAPECSLDRPCYFFADEDDEIVHKETTQMTRGTAGCSNSDMDCSEGVETGADHCENYSASSIPRNHPPKVAKRASGEEASCYMRAMTMPAERTKKMVVNRCNSFGHVHPKLPDYEELAAKFTALKKEHSRKRQG